MTNPLSRRLLHRACVPETDHTALHHQIEDLQGRIEELEDEAARARAETERVRQEREAALDVLRSPLLLTGTTPEDEGEDPLQEGLRHHRLLWVALLVMHLQLKQWGQAEAVA